MLPTCDFLSKVFLLIQLESYLKDDWCKDRVDGLVHVGGHLRELITGKLFSDGAAGIGLSLTEEKRELPLSAVDTV